MKSRSTRASYYPLAWALPALLLLTLGLLATAGASSAAGVPAIQPATIEGSAPIGSVVTATLRLENSGVAPLSMLIYETAMPPTSTLQAPQGDARELRVRLPQQDARIDPRLSAALQRAPDGQSEFVVYLADQADMSAAARTEGWAERGAAVYQTLHGHAERSQAALRRWLDARGVRYTPLWLVNALVVRGDAPLAQQLAGRAEVALLRINEIMRLEAQPASAVAASSAVDWNLSLIGAENVWQTFGVRGEGIVVANIDTGVEYTHDALKQRYRGYLPGGSFQHSYNWYDAAGGAETPVDINGHGTHTMGTMVGESTASSGEVGVAPSARWIAARACVSASCSTVDLIEAMQWVAAPTDPDGANPRPDLRPHIVNNSWGGSGGNRDYADYVIVWNALGIFSAFAAGNAGSFEPCQTMLSPGDYPESFAVGATSASDQLASFSSRGPTRDGRRKPDVVAPGLGIRSTTPNNSYGLSSGTSMATPHVAGLAALIWSANPQLISDLAATRSIIEQTALPIPSSACGSSGVPNNLFGWGRINAFAAVGEAQVDIAWLDAAHQVQVPAQSAVTISVTLDGRRVAAPGQYQSRLLVGSSNLSDSTPVTVTFDVLDSPDAVHFSGQLSDHWTGGEVSGAVLFEGGPSITTDMQGAFTLTLRLGSYQVRAQAYGYQPLSETLQVLTDTQRAFVLLPLQPHLEIASPAISTTLDFGQQQSYPITLTNSGTLPLTITTAVLAQEYSLEASSEGGPALSWYDLSAAEALAFSDDLIYTDALKLGFAMPVFGTLYDRIYLSSNGWFSFVPDSDPEPAAYCFPSTELPDVGFAPFWTDLDPSKGGAIRAAQVDSETYVISFEQVPLFQQPSIQSPAPTYSFQAVLRQSGLIQYLYGPLGDMPQRYSVGYAARISGGYSLFCSTSAAPAKAGPLEGQAWSLEHQRSPSHWLVSSPSPLVIAPGQSSSITATLWGNVGWLAQRQAPYLGRLMLSSNDPLLPSLQLVARLRIGPPPYQQFFPRYVR